MTITHPNPNKNQHKNKKKHAGHLAPRNNNKTSKTSMLRIEDEGEVTPITETIQGLRSSA